MDEFGIASAAKVGLRIYETASRRSGRTTRLVERATDEDQIIAPDRDIARYIERMVRDAGKKTRVLVSRPGEVPMQRVGTAPRGRTFFDHSWVEAHFLRAIQCAEEDLECFHRETSKTWPEKPDPRQNRMNEMWVYNL